jgi:hypothetical protein
MDVRLRLQAEFEREVADSEAAVLLRLIRARSGELTIGDLVALLDTPHGARLHAHPAVELRLDRGSTTRADPSGEKAIQALYTMLQRAEQPMTMGALARLAGCTLAQTGERLDALVAAGLVAAIDRPPEPRGFAVVADPGQPRTAVLLLAALVVTILRASGRSMKLMDLIAASGCSEERIRRATRHLKLSQKVTCTGRNSGTRYALPNAATTPAH